MKILWITNDINQVGGIEKVICGLSNYFVGKGHDVMIASVNSSKNQVFFSLDSRVSILHCKVDKEKQTRKEFLYAVRDILKKISADVVIGCQESINLGLVLYKKYFPGQVIVTQHNTSDFFSKKRLLLNTIFYRFADKFFVLTEKDRKYYEKRGIRNCQVMPNAYHGEAVKRSDLKSHTIISVGRLTEVKQHDRLIRAFAKVYPEYKDWKLKIIGDGEEMENLKALIKALDLGSGVEMTGFRTDVLQQMEKAGMFVLTSWNEGFPLVILEAMTCGLPILSYDIVSIREEVTDKAGILVPLNDEAALAEAMKALMKDEELRKEYGEKAYQKSLEYTLEEIGARWIAELS